MYFIIVIHIERCKCCVFQKTGKENIVDIDFWLIQKMKRGDENAFDVFVHKYYNKILNYCVYHCMDKSYAEDLTQETFVRFFAKLSDYRYRGKTINYLYTIAGNLCKDYFKKAKDSVLDEQEIEAQSKLLHSGTEEMLDKLILKTEINNLPEKEKKIILLRYYRGKTQGEVANMLGISQVQVSRIESKIIELLKKKMTQNNNESRLNKFEEDESI